MVYLSAQAKQLGLTMDYWVPLLNCFAKIFYAAICAYSPLPFTRTPLLSLMEPRDYQTILQ